MTLHKLVGAAAALTLSCSAMPAQADVLSFTGSMTGISTGGPDASCAPLPLRTSIDPATSVGYSSLGDFTYSSNVCTGVGPLLGTFIIDFGIDSFEGTQSGTATPTGTPGLLDLLIDYTILDGTGRFLGATGSFIGTGNVDMRTPPTQVALALTGNINAPAVPEPGTWALMLVGFAGVGMALRYRRRRDKLHQLARPHVREAPQP